MTKRTYPFELKDEAVNYYIANECTLEEASLLYGISTTTISRRLEELGYKELKRDKTDRERDMLKYLASKGITDLNELKKHI